MTRQMLLTCGELNGTWWLDPSNQHEILVADSMAGAQKSYSRAAFYHGGKVFIANNSGHGFVSAYTAEGELLWAKYLSDTYTASIRRLVALGDGNILALGSDNYNSGYSAGIIFNPADGTVISSFTVTDCSNNLFYFENGVWGVNNSGNVCKYDLTGTLVNTVTGLTNQWEGSFADGYLFSGTDNKVYKLDTTNFTIQWTFDLATLTAGSLSLSGSNIYGLNDVLAADGSILVPTFDGSNMYITRIDSSGSVVGAANLIFSDVDGSGETYQTIAVANDGPYIAYFHALRVVDIPGFGTQTDTSEAIYGLKADWTTDQLFYSDYAYSTQIVNFPDYAISDTVTVDGSPADLDLFLIHVPTMKVVDKTTSTSGTYTLKALSNGTGEHMVVCKSPDSTRNYQIRAHLTAGA